MFLYQDWFVSFLLNTFILDFLEILAIYLFLNLSIGVLCWDDLLAFGRILTYVFISIQLSTIFLISGKGIFLVCLMNIISFSLLKYHRPWKRQDVLHGSSHISHWCIHSLCGSDHVYHISHRPGILGKGLSNVQSFEIWSTTRELVYKALSFLPSSIFRFWYCWFIKSLGLSKIIIPSNGDSFVVFYSMFS